jgi:hypothetical protein
MAPEYNRAGDRRLAEARALEMLDSGLPLEHYTGILNTGNLSTGC